MRKLIGNFFLVKFVRDFLDRRKSSKMMLALEQELSDMEQQLVPLDIPKFNSDFSVFEWNGISYMVPDKFQGMPVNCDTMRIIAEYILATEKRLLEDLNA